MKKILSLMFVFVTFGLPSMAVITPEEATSEKYIENHGHSQEMARLIDLENTQINGTKSNYKSKDPAIYSNKAVSFVRHVFMYFDPGLNDDKFMKHDTKYSTRYDDL